ncbi:MAG: DUF5107 domain-containing protein, partial [Verrucomicrobiales bacterium]|nr:DUF5107 domain-containing protein [Verrucomicrobiales bacterium]
MGPRAVARRRSKPDATPGGGDVRAAFGHLDLPTYVPAVPDPNPLFLEQRVYQGSSGRVYPLPVIDRIAEQSAPRRWKTVVLENQYLWVLILPELGGRVHALVDKTNGYDLIYRQEVIKPALVGLAGPWLSGGIEFNWPQHHRPATFMPTDVQLERGVDGSITVWCGDHDPLQRMKGMHGLCLRPGVARLELRVRVANRTPFTQTFLWWANVATRVHEGYQSFFPGDVTAVADHARRAMSAFPRCRGRYYGVDYAARGRHGIPSDEIPSRYVPPHVRGGRLRPGEVAYSAADLGFYANIPVPTSYMALGSRGDFFGGYDHQAGAGLVHVANHHLSPGKKQWTWGNHEFGYAWDRNLTDPDGTGECAPYIELMAGVYTDNQPDFSFLMPGETRTWTQYWYPIQRLGPVQAANPRAAIHFDSERDGVELGVVVTAQLPRARIELERAGGGGRRTWRQTLQPGRPFLRRLSKVQDGRDAGGWVVRVRDENAQLVLEYRHEPVPRTPMPAAAREPETPRAMASVDELFLTGVHLEQYRHATRCPTAYWREGLRRDPGEARCHTALGRWHLRRGEWDLAEAHLRRALERLTRWNANPSEGEALYLLGWCRRSQDHHDEAYDLFYKATWNQAWQGAAFQALAEIDAGRGDWEQAEAHLQQVLRVNRDHPGARGLLAVTLQKQGRKAEARALLDDTLKHDPLDAWARWMRGR